MHKLTIQNGHIFLDDVRLQDVTGYELKSSAGASAELTLKLIVTTSNVSFNESLPTFGMVGSVIKPIPETIKLSDEKKQWIADYVKLNPTI